MLVTAGAQLNSENGLSLYYALVDRYEGVVRALVEADADVHLRGDKEKAALQIAFRLRHTKIVKMLVAAGTEVSSENLQAL
jgi:ankyrin repeat protein